MSWGEQLGIARAALDRAEHFARLFPAKARQILGKPPVYDNAEVTKITVDCRTGERTVEKPLPTAETVNPFDRKIIPVDLRYRNMPSIAAIVGEQARIANLILPPSTIAAKDTRNRPQHMKLRPTYAHAITQVCCQVWGVTFSRITAPGRERDVVRPRHAAIKIMRDRGGVSYPEIAKYFGFDHSSVMYGYRKAGGLIECNVEFRENYDHACALLDEAAVRER